MSKNDAPGQAAGYLFQPQKALLWLAKSSTNSVIGVEIGDDVVIESEDGALRLGQLKNTVTGQPNPFSDRSVGLWKTMAIWSERIQCAPDNSEFYLCTNRPISQDCLAARLAIADNKGQIALVVDDLESIIVNPSDTIRPFTSTVDKLNKETLSRLVSRIKLEDGFGANHTIQKETVSYLQLPSNIKSDHVYNSLLGWLSSALKSAWDNSEAGWVTGQSFADQKQAIIDELHRRCFSARAAREIQVTQSDLEAKRNDLCVRQLQLIGASEDQILDAITELLRESEETMRLFAQGVITKKALEERNDRLFVRWQHIFRRHCRNNNAEQSNDRDTGYSIFDETTDHKEPIGEVVSPEKYMTAGAFHRLANNAIDSQFIGWHPDYKNLFSE